MIRYTLRTAWRLIVIVVGGSVLLIGIAMMVLPGPATVMIPIGLAILATEFVWARRLLRRIAKEVKNLTSSGREGDPSHDKSGTSWPL
jgi:tellurite resistance protein TerC